MDVDLDFPSTFNPLDVFPWTKASMEQNGKLLAHPCGIYPQPIPRDPITGLAAVPYKQAEDLGYFKIDFLHLHVYDHFESREQIEALLEIEPEWELLKSPSVVKQLFQLRKHFDVVNKIKPASVEELADCLALIRPAKMRMLDKYLEDRDAVRRRLYLPTIGNDKAYSFKKAHAVAYALVIVLQLHLIGAGIEF